MSKSMLTRIRPVIGPLAYVGALAGLLGGTFFAVVTFLSDPAVSEKETATARVPPKVVREAEQVALPRLFEKRIGPAVIHPGAPGGVIPNQMARVKAAGQVSENHRATLTRQPTLIDRARTMTTSSEETNSSIDHFFSR